ncbi:FliM/FliN family flagellar motor switch protein [Acidovorax facilis]|uniref:FliM/FliN family flagellar motor switch protein n=1 Tax=Acidovorax facilis TaxID=12917 RepID=UPI003CF5B39E
MKTVPSSEPANDVASRQPIVQAINVPHIQPPVDASPPLLANANPLHQIRTLVQVCVGDAEVSVGELLKARDGEVLKLNRRVDEAVDLLIEGQIIARGQLVALDGHFAVRITELPRPLSLATS